MIAKAGNDLPGAPGCLPTPSQALLLKAACLPKEPARAAWRAWRARNGFHHPDPVSTRLLVWIFHRREELGLHDEAIGSLEPLYWFAWMQNQRLLNAADKVVQSLQKEGVEVVLLKGLPLLVEAYGDEGARSMDDFDLLVRPSDLPQSLTLLNRLGWQPDTPSLFATLHLRHSEQFCSADGIRCDLHWRIVRFPNPIVDEAFVWQSRRRIRVRNQDVFTLSAELMVIQLIVHGMSWQRIPPIRWILDLALFLRTQIPDWNNVLEEAVRRGVTLPIAEGFAVFEQIVPDLIPAWVRQKAFLLPHTSKQRHSYEQVARPYEEASLRVVWEVYRADYHLAKATGKIASGWNGFLQHLCGYLRVVSPRQMPPRVAARLWRRLCGQG